MAPLPARPEDSQLAEAAEALARTRAFLASGAPWPGEPPPECIETHASLVFLTRDRAFKLKKPVRLSHVDLTTLAARARSCREELRLNRELAGEVYRGLVPLTRRADGGLRLGGDGPIADWLVEMVRLPAASMLDRRLAAGPPPVLAEIEAACDVLLAFYAARPSPPDAGERVFRRLLRESRINADHLAELAGALGGPLPRDLVEGAVAEVEARRGEILARGAAGVIVEGHGDLRPEHVCLTRPPVVFDRVEFDHDFRLVDPFDEFDTLGRECALLGGGWIRGVLLHRLAAAGVAPPGPGLLRLYGVVHWLTRARLAIDHLRDATVRTPRKWPALARRCLAEAAAVRERPR